VTRGARLAWALAGLAIALHVVGHLFLALGIGTGTPADRVVTLGNAGHWIAFYAFPLVGAVIASRQSRNAIGWLFLAIGLTSGFQLAGLGYADYALYVEDGGPPGGSWSAWTALWMDSLFFLGIVLLVLLFPDGRLPSRRWRPVLVALVVGSLALTAVRLLRPGPLEETTMPEPNPAGLDSAKTILDIVEAIGALLFVPATILACVCAVRRFRRARGVERKQFQWFALAAAWLLVAFVVAIVAEGEVAQALIGIAFAGLAVAAGIAILRYRLYEIDRIVSRTLVYASLTVLLGAAYVGLVLAGQALFSSFAGGSNLAIAVSTLVVAALFLPLRARVQHVVDRRFYRSRYDAARTLEAFGAQLRRETDVDSLRSDLLAAVGESMRPASAGVWLRRRG
jgi:hypothetical protein